jgi:arylsulfatase
MRANVIPLALALLAACAPERPDHLVLVTVDSLRADRLGAYGYAGPGTPAVDGLARQSILFERAYAHSSMTLPSVASLLTGRLPAEHGIYSNGGSLGKEVTTLAEHARGAGFRTAAFLGSYALRPNRRLSRGFEAYTRAFRDREQNRAQPENGARWLTDQAIAWLATLEAGERFLLWIHYQEPHGPYTPASFAEPAAAGPILPQSSSQSGRGAIPRYQWLGHGRLTEYEARYDGEIAEMDRQLGRLLTALQEGGRLEHSVVLFTADHGEAFGEEELYCAHGEGLGEVLLRVPLLLRAPGLAPAVRRDAVRQIDVAPTLLALLDLEGPSLPGRSLLEEHGDRDLVAQLVQRERRWRSIRNRDGWLLDEGVDALGEGPLVAELERLAPWPTRLVDRLTPEEAEALRNMGYAN